MGKQSRRKKSKSRRKQKGESSSDESKGSNLLHNIRHPNPEIRHAALAALMNSIMDPERMSSKGKIRVDLLQAIRERVMDKDLECAQLAAGCLSNYLRGCEEQDWDTTSSWAIIFLQRLKECQEIFEKMDLEKETLKKQKRLWALTMQCLSALCNLVEVNHKALAHFGTENAIDILLSLIKLGTEHLEKRKIKDPEESSKDIFTYNRNSLTYAAQTLHSALDENTELMRCWMDSGRSWNIICLTCKNQKLPISSRLHCAGCLVTAWALSNDEVLQSAVVNDAVPLLNSILEFDSAEANTLVQRINKTFEIFRKEEEDSAMEKEIIRKVTERKEPARQIARRQKAMRDKEKHNKQEGKGQVEGDMAMEEEEETMDTEGLSNNKKENDNAREAFESAKSAWHQKLGPLELALEILANLTGLNVVPNESGDINMEDWGPEQEKKLLEMDGQSTLNLSPLDISLFETIVNVQIPNRLVTLLKVLCNPMEGDCLPEVKDEIQDLQSKCGACLGNCVGEHFPNWTDGLLQELRSALETSKGNPSIANAIAAGFRSRSTLRKQCQPSDLELLVNLAKNSPCQKEAIEILGILCSCEIHDEAINRTICSTLLNIYSKRADIMNEILNALMDIYGNDDCHPNVFDSQNVLAYFQQITPTFKRMIQCDRDQFSIDEVEQWRETLLNASRFISYKKGQR